jgi:hypothetical protein
MAAVRQLGRSVRRRGRGLLLLIVGIAIVAPIALMWARMHPYRVAVDDDPGRHGQGGPRPAD